MNLIRHVLAVLAVLVTVAAGAACSSSATSATSSSPPPRQKTNVVVRVLPAVNTASLYLAIKEGFFAQAGLTVTPKQLPTSTEAIPPMRHRTTDIPSGTRDAHRA